MNNKSETSIISDRLHDMLANHNKSSGKVFYYTEDETRDLCKHAFITNLPSEVFNMWWNDVKKK
jgi:hypothetical protein